ncbi:MAG: hypothetical protein P8H59_03980 [Flavobacteriales bacterium]|nr:hypothetical protein [Flavobacteriales bacterium]MDG1780086.1 hypothetical protein [Flavobacteriales bacterium]MDG2247254.1 hypothetical protein [Flavobacteriales bacterium]
MKNIVVIAIVTSISMISICLFGTGDRFVQSFSPPFRIPKIIGIGEGTTLCLSPEYMLNAWYNIERMDSIQDTLDLLSPPSLQNCMHYQFFKSGEIEMLPVSNTNLQLIADTTNELSMTKEPIWASGLFYRFFDTESEVLQDDTLIQQVKSFPIYLANTSGSDYAEVEVQDGSLMMIVEAVDSDGDWKPIEYWSNSWCGNSYFNFMLPPNHMMMTRGIKCSGDFYTNCRMKLYNAKDSLISNEFHMSINETQFAKPLEKK